MPTVVIGNNEEENAIAERGKAEMASNFTKAIGGGFHGEWETKDQGTPYLTLVAAQSALVEELDGCKPGMLVFDKEFILNKPLNLTVLDLQKDWTQIMTDPNDSSMPKRWSTEAQAQAEGFRQGRRSDGGKVYGPSATGRLLIEVPADAGLLNYDGKHYAQALFGFKGSSWGLASKILKACLRIEKPPHNVSWQMDSEKITNNNNSWWVPKLANLGEHKQEFVDFVVKEAL